MEMPSPTRDHERLHAFAGEWTGTEIMHPSPWAPQGSRAEAHICNRIAAGGFVVVQDYQQSAGGRVTFAGHGVLSFDARAGEYAMHWWDAMGMPVNEFRGRFEGDDLTMTCRGQGGAQRSVFRCADLAQGRYSFLMEVSPDGEHWNACMEGDYVRA